MYSNVRGLRGKVAEMRTLRAHQHSDIIFITESWLSPDISDEEMHVTGMELFRRDREHRAGGGVAIYVNSCLKARMVSDTALTQLPESLWCYFTLHSTKYLLGVIYRSPTCSPTHKEMIIKAILTTSSANYDSVVIAGDFNTPSILFETEGRRIRSFNQKLKDAIKTAGLSEKVGDATRWGPNGNASRLDYVLTNDELLIEDVCIQPPLGLSDHAVITFSMITREALQLETPNTFPCYSKANYETMRDYLMNASWP
ncbi:unnamed protein product, partial [Heterobilharzia americana]